MTNSADPDQMAQKPADLDLHCLLRDGLKLTRNPVVRNRPVRRVHSTYKEGAAKINFYRWSLLPDGMVGAVT